MVPFSPCKECSTAARHNFCFYVSTAFASGQEAGGTIFHVKKIIMEGQRPIGNIEKERDFDPAKEKRTMDNNQATGGLNDGNPNADHTPATASEQASREMHEQQTGSRESSAASS